MEWTTVWTSLQKWAQTYIATSSAVSSVNFPDRPKQIYEINDYVYGVGSPSNCPSIELVFFHGLQPEGSEKAYYTTWLTRDGSKLWLDWILEDHQNARILLVSYDGFMKKTAEHGNLDMHCTCENLIQDLTDSKVSVGQAGCPVVLVGHCIGGLVMKSLTDPLQTLYSKYEFYHPDNRVQNLFLNVRGFFFFACPNHGSRLGDESTELSKGPFLEELKTLHSLTQRRNESFRDLRSRRGWKTYGVGENLKTKLGDFEGVIVPEASTRADVDSYYTDSGADHFTVCRLTDKMSSSFHRLRDFVQDMLEEDNQRRAAEINFQTKVFGLEGREGREGPVETLIRKLQSSKRVAIVGMAGIGKSTLVRKVFCSHRESYDFTCFLSDVIMKKITGENSENYLRGEIMKNLFYRGRKADKSCIWKSLTGKKLLLVLDDVNDVSQVPETIVSNLSPESNVIVTSREHGFLKRNGFTCHKVLKLEPDDSERLFCHHAFGGKVANQVEKDRVAGFIRLLDGLPLGLVLVGGFLKGQDDLTVWDCVQERLSSAESFDGNKQNKLKLVMEMSYESLAIREQQMFVDIATCFHGENLEHVRRAWDQCGWADALGLTILEEKNLVTIEKSNVLHPGKSKEIEVIRMHEMLRSFGRSQARLDHDNGTKRSRVRYDVSDPLPTIWPFSEEPKVEVLMICCGKLEENGYRAVQMQDLHGLKKLQVLWLDGVSLSGPWSLLPPKLAYMRISFSHWISERTFWGHQGSSHSVGIPEEDAKLRLDIAHCSNLEGILHGLRNLERLKDLQILSCGCSRTPPNSLRHLEAIESLDITWSDDFKALSDIVGQLQTLQKLVMRSCIDHGSQRTRHQLEFLECQRQERGWAVVRHGH